jgi:DNA primase
VLLDRFFASRRRDPRSAYGRTSATQTPRRTGVRPEANATEIAAERARILTAILLRHPALFRDVEHAYAGLDLDPLLSRLRDALTDWAIHAEVLDSQALMDHLDGFGLSTAVARILAGTPVPLPECASSAAMPAEAEEGWWHIFGFLNVDRLAEEVVAATGELNRTWTNETQRKLIALKSALDKIRTGEPDGAGLAAA